MLCWALRQMDVPIVLIGGSKHWPSYAELCRSISGSRLTIIDHMPQHMLASAYAAAAVHSLPSWMETCGLVSLEAALSGTPLLGAPLDMSLSIWKVMLGMQTLAMQPASETQLKRQCRQDAGIRPIAMKRKVLERFNWERTVDATELLYRKVLERRS